MLRYVKAAFWASPEIQGLGRIPANAVLCAGAAILGFGAPALWLVALGLETGYLALLASNPRFQRLVDAMERAEPAVVPPVPPHARLNQLDSERAARLERRSAEVLDIYQEARSNRSLIEGNREALSQLAAVFTRLLRARALLRSTEFAAGGAPIRARISELEHTLAGEDVSRKARDSKLATLQILRQRLINIERRDEMLEEVESDLTRIEAQVDLAWENAAMHGKTEAISGQIELASLMFLDGLGGETLAPGRADMAIDGPAPEHPISVRGTEALQE